jgi:pimeloyl-ACP methyl ester carboxylesterase
LRFGAIASAALLTITAWGPARGQEYPYPYHDPYLATVIGASLNADGLTPGVKRQVVHVSVLPGRDTLPGLEGRGVLSVALYRQKGPAPLMLILPGTGSTPYFGLATYYAKLFYKQGSHVVILASPMSWNFALAASRWGAPGYTPEDAQDLYVALQQILPVLRSRYQLKATRVNLLGMSLGALEGAYLSLIDADEGKIGIARFLLVNPPLDVSSVLRRLDEWASLSAKIGPQRARDLEAKAAGFVEAFSRQRRDDLAAFDALAKGFATFSREELQYLIAAYLQTSLPELVTVTQAIHDQQILAAPPDRVRQRLEEAHGMTFTDYADRVALPVWRRESGEPSASSEIFASRGSLGAIVDRLKGNPRVFIMHNVDDFLADGASIQRLKEALGDQVKLYPYGGHLGNLWFPQNRAYVLGLFRP